MNNKYSCGNRVILCGYGGSLEGRVGTVTENLPTTDGMPYYEVAVGTYHVTVSEAGLMPLVGTLTGALRDATYAASRNGYVHPKDEWPPREGDAIESLEKLGPEDRTEYMLEKWRGTFERLAK